MSPRDITALISDEGVDAEENRERLCAAFDAVLEAMGKYQLGREPILMLFAVDLRNSSARFVLDYATSVPAGALR